jgi:hypothetical protein
VDGQPFKFSLQLADTLIPDVEELDLAQAVASKDYDGRAQEMSEALIDEAPQNQVEFPSVDEEVAQGFNVFDNYDDYNEEYNPVDYGSEQDIES